MWFDWFSLGLLIIFNTMLFVGGRLMNCPRCKGWSPLFMPLLHKKGCPSGAK